MFKVLILYQIFLFATSVVIGIAADACHSFYSVHSITYNSPT